MQKMSIVNKGGPTMDMPNSTINPNILQLTKYPRNAIYILSYNHFSVICINPLVNTFLQYATCYIVAAN